MVYSSIVLYSFSLFSLLVLLSFFLHIFVTASVLNKATLPHNISVVILGACVTFIEHHIAINMTTSHPNSPANLFELSPVSAVSKFIKNFFITP